MVIALALYIREFLRGVDDACKSIRGAVPPRPASPATMFPSSARPGPGLGSPRLFFFDCINTRSNSALHIMSHPTSTRAANENGQGPSARQLVRWGYSRQHIGLAQHQLGRDSQPHRLFSHALDHVLMRDARCSTCSTCSAYHTLRHYTLHLHTICHGPRRFVALQIANPLIHSVQQCTTYG